MGDIMKKAVIVTFVAAIFALGFAFGAFAAKKRGVDSMAWQDVAAREAAENLLDLAVEFAEQGSWENIHLGRTYYLSGDQERGEALLNRFSQGKAKAGDLIRIGRVYAQADEWQKAKPLFDQVLSLEPNDASWLIEIGAYYNLNGDRAHAERLFARGFKEAPRNLNSTLTAAGSYLGLAPRKR
jgi:tetratricopeptide (TPR) repeat protein